MMLYSNDDPWFTKESLYIQKELCVDALGTEILGDHNQISNFWAVANFCATYQLPKHVHAIPKQTGYINYY